MPAMSANDQRNISKNKENIFIYSFHHQTLPRSIKSLQYISGLFNTFKSFIECWVFGLSLEGIKKN